MSCCYHVVTMHACRKQQQHRDRERASWSWLSEEVQPKSMTDKCNTRIEVSEVSFLPSCGMKELNQVYERPTIGSSITAWGKMHPNSSVAPHSRGNPCPKIRVWCTGKTGGNFWCWSYLDTGENHAEYWLNRCWITGERVSTYSLVHRCWSRTLTYQTPRLALISAFSLTPQCVRPVHVPSPSPSPSGQSQ